jgi:hypothetical protein
MPSKTKSKTNVSKSAAAQHQCAKAIERAANGEAGIQFYSVQKALGNAFFSLRDHEGKDLRGTPRGLFTKGTMLVSVGQIVVAEGDAKGLEIVGVIQRRSDATALVKAGAMPREILAHAVAAGAMTVAADESDDDLFETLADEEDAAGGGSKVERAKADAMRSVAALASRLGSKSASTAKTIVESAADASVHDAAEYDAFASPKRVKRKLVCPSAPTIPMRPAGFFPPPEPVSEMMFWDNAPEKNDVFVSKPLAPAPVSWEDEVDIDAI